MPSHKIHISIANEINKKLKLNKNKILLGSVLPDLSCDKHHISHFKTNISDHSFYNVELFLSKYNIENPIFMGYLIHLLTDRFYNNYVRSNYYIFKNNKLCGIKGVNGNIYGTPSMICDVKQDDFHIYDLYLLQNKSFPKINFIDDIPKIDECIYSIDYIKEYIENYNNEIKEDNIYSLEYKYLNQEEAKEIYENCINYILEYLNELEN